MTAAKARRTWVITAVGCQKSAVTVGPSVAGLTAHWYCQSTSSNLHLPAGCGFFGCAAASAGAEAVVTGTCWCWPAWPWCFPGLTPFFGVWLGGTVHVTPGIFGRPTGGLLANGELRHSSRNARSYTIRVPAHTHTHTSHRLHPSQQQFLLVESYALSAHFYLLFTCRLILRDFGIAVTSRTVYIIQYVQKKSRNI